MPTIDVIWWNVNPDAITRGYWDQGLYEDLIAGRLWNTPYDVDYRSWDRWADFVSGNPHGTLEALPGAVVIIPAQHNASDRSIKMLNEDLAQLPWVLLIVTGDEERKFDTRKVKHDTMRVWQMSPLPSDLDEWRPIPMGYPPGTREFFYAGLDQVHDDRRYDVTFSGQVNNTDRKQLKAAIAEIELNGDPELAVSAVFTGGFTQGMPRIPIYLDNLALSRVALCPHGVVCEDSFRLYEALEAGCCPLVHEAPFWESLWGTGHGALIGIDEWTSLPDDVGNAVDEWRIGAIDASAWWQQQKRDLAYDLDTTVMELAGFVTAKRTTTVVISTSPTSDPDQLDRTLAVIDSIRNQDGLGPDVEIIIGCDGIRSEQAHLRPVYETYLYALMRYCNRPGSQCVPVVEQSFKHQALTFKHALRLVETELVLFMEHDMALVTDYQVPWSDVEVPLLDGRANVVRFMYESMILPEYAPYHPDGLEPLPENYPLVRTAQWSQRPHLARTDFYRYVMGTYFGRNARTMIEDVMHGVLSYWWREYGDEGWDKFRVWTYAPGDLPHVKRCVHLDGRKNDEKFPMVYEYPQGTPEGAPRAMSERVD